MCGSIYSSSSVPLVFLRHHFCFSMAAAAAVLVFFVMFRLAFITDYIIESLTQEFIYLFIYLFIYSFILYFQVMFRINSNIPFFFPLVFSRKCPNAFLSIPLPFVNVFGWFAYNFQSMTFFSFYFFYLILTETFKFSIIRKWIRIDFTNQLAFWLRNIMKCIIYFLGDRAFLDILNRSIFIIIIFLL